MASKAGKTAAKAPKVTKVNTKTSDEEVSKQAPADKKVPTHPSTAEMVTEAIGKLNDRTGSSLLAIKKSIAESHDVDVEKLAPFIKRFLKKAVETGVLIQPKGKGAAGSFKLAAKSKPVKKPAGEKTEKPASAGKPKKPAAKKVPNKEPSPSSDGGSEDEEIPPSSESEVEEYSPPPKKSPAKAKAPKPATVKARSPKVPKKTAEKKKAPDTPKTNSKASPKTKLPATVKPAAKSKRARKSASPRKGATGKS